MKATEVKPGDVLKSRHSSNLIVRQTKKSDTNVRLLLAAGRTDPGVWYVYGPTAELDIYRPE